MNYFGFLEKIVLNLLKEIDVFLKDFDMIVVCKLKIGVYIEGDNKVFVEVS